MIPELAPHPALSTRLSIAFAWSGHSLMHIMVGLYLTVVLAIEPEWGLGYDDLIRLWTPGALMVGLGAPVAGWLGDRWSESRMMALFFWLTGAGAVWSGLAGSASALMGGLTLLGLGASIYHPVGMAWVIRHAQHAGKALGAQGIFGSLGVATAAVIAGGLSQAIHWRAAFLVPGVVSLLLGLALTLAITLGWVVDPESDARPQPKPSRDEAMRAFFVLSVTMLCGGLAANAVLTLMPKWFGDRLGIFTASQTLEIGALVTVVYLVASLPQLLGGHFADRFPLRRVYAFCLLGQVPLLLLAAWLAGPAVAVIATALVGIVNMQVPAENLLLSRYTPARYRGLAFGAKFVLAFGSGPIAVEMVALFYERTHSFSALFLTLIALMLLAFGAAWLLPEGRPLPATSSPAPAPSP